MSPKRQKVITIVCVMLACVVATIAYASGTQQVAYPIISRLWNLFISVAFMAGVLVTATAVIQFIQSIKDEDADKKQQAIRTVVVGIALLSFQLLLDPILATLGFFR